jgi:hypothetical protein
MDKSLAKVRATWEGADTAVAFNEFKFGAVSVTQYMGTFSVYRYFKINDVWGVSVDLGGGTAEAAFAAYSKAVSLTH